MPYKDLVSIVNSTLEVLSLVTMYMQRLRYDKVDAILSYVLLSSCYTFRFLTSTNCAHKSLVLHKTNYVISLKWLKMRQTTFVNLFTLFAKCQHKKFIDDAEAWDVEPQAVPLVVIWSLKGIEDMYKPMK